MQAGLPVVASILEGEKVWQKFSVCQNEYTADVCNKTELHDQLVYVRPKKSD